MGYKTVLRLCPTSVSEVEFARQYVRLRLLLRTPHGLHRSHKLNRRYPEAITYGRTNHHIDEE